MKSYFIRTPMTANMKYLLRKTVLNGFCDSEIWILATARHGPASSNVVEGLLRRSMLDYFEGNNGKTLRVTEKGRNWVLENET